MDIEQRITQLEQSLQAIEAKLDQLIADQANSAGAVNRHPDLIRRMSAVENDDPTGAVPARRDPRTKGACIAVAMVMVVIFLIAVIAAMQELGAQLKNTFPETTATK